MNIAFTPAYFKFNTSAKPSSSKIPVTAFRTNVTVHIPFGNGLRPVCILGDKVDGSVSYTRLFDVLHDHCTVGDEFTDLIGFVYVDDRIILNFSS